MRIRRKKEENKIISEINITPLTDVFMVLLIIFMIATPMIIQSAIKVKLPQTVSSEQQETKTIMVTLTSERRIFINDKEVSIDSVTKEIKQKMSDNAEYMVVVSADKNVSYGQAVSLIDAVKSAGVSKIAIATEKKGKQP